ncbi:hypothetical protein T484DRAFT_1936622, partial [Baffinella frigidus]
IGRTFTAELLLTVKCVHLFIFACGGTPPWAPRVPRGPRTPQGGLVKVRHIITRAAPRPSLSAIQIDGTIKTRPVGPPNSWGPSGPTITFPITFQTLRRSAERTISDREKCINTHS